MHANFQLIYQTYLINNRLIEHIRFIFEFFTFFCRVIFAKIPSCEILEMKILIFKCIKAKLIVEP